MDNAIKFLIKINLEVFYKKADYFLQPTRQSIPKATNKDGSVPIIFNLTERKPRSLKAGVVYGTDLGLGAKLGWEHRNFFGSGDKLETSLPVTLGGTSNHFKVDKLKEVGYWDAYNVTEDVDLGIRLYLNGYKVHLINSTTMEEAPTDVATWMAQIARWIKGFIQTLYIFIKAKKDLSKFSIFKICTVYIFGLSTYHCALEAMSLTVG